MDHVELKRLQTQLKQEKSELKAAEQTSQQATQKVSKHQQRIASLNKTISKITEGKKKIVISEHAILRYLERHKGLDIEAIKKEILPEKISELVVELGGKGKFPVQIDMQITN